MKRIIILGIIMMLCGLFLSYKEDFIRFYQDNIELFSPSSMQIAKNNYYRDYDFLYLQNTDNFKPSSKEDINNIFYTVINSGVDSFTFYCPKSYETCTDDIKILANNQTKLSHINNFVHPYNGFKHIETQYNNLGEVTITIKKNYSSDDINVLNAKIDEIINLLISGYETDKEKIKIIHDYIVNNTKYDSDRSDYNIVKYKSDIAYGPLIERFGICGGYSDAMQLFLEKFGIKNFKVSSENHVWNAVYLDGKWYHLDLTWDDPVTFNNSDILQDDFFLISTEQLLYVEHTEHDYDQDIYLELKEA